MEYNGTYGFLSLRVRRSCDWTYFWIAGHGRRRSQNMDGDFCIGSWFWCICDALGLIGCIMIVEASIGNMILYSFEISNVHIMTCLHHKPDRFHGAIRERSRK